MKYFAVLGFAMVMCIASTSSAVLVVEARGFTMCTVIEDGDCSGGTTYMRPSGLQYKDTNCDWGGGDCERWIPGNTTSFSDAKGVFHSCCMSAVGATSSSYDFEYYDYDDTSWMDVSTEGYMGVDPVPGACSVANLIFYGTEVDAFDDWDYGSNYRVARCFGTATFPGSGEITKGIEYWFAGS